MARGRCTRRQATGSPHNTTRVRPRLSSLAGEGGKRETLACVPVLMLTSMEGETLACVPVLMLTSMEAAAAHVRRIHASNVSSALASSGPRSAASAAGMKRPAPWAPGCQILPRPISRYRF